MYPGVVVLWHSIVFYINLEILSKMEEKGSTKTEAANFESQGLPTQDFLEICDQLDLSEQHELVDKSWKQYDTIGQQCVLEVKCLAFKFRRDPDFRRFCFGFFFPNFDFSQKSRFQGGEKAWMACSIYVTAWQSAPFGQEPLFKFSLSKLLQLTNTRFADSIDPKNPILAYWNSSKN